jgi:hypothetical protein
MNRTRESQATGLEALEQRLALSLGANAQEIYYPDGFANSTITETVSITNPGMATVQYELWARYEVGQRDQLIRAGSITPGGWTDVEISDPANPAAIAVRANTPFAFVLKSDGQLSAALRHDDFNSSTGESFATSTGTDWSIANVTRDHATTRDYIVVYNTGASAVQIQVEFFKDAQLAFTLTSNLDGFRRGGWNINRMASLPRGEYSVRIHGSGNIVVGHSHYDLVNLISSINIATFDRGALAGTILSAEFDERDRPGCGPAQDTLVAVFNPGNDAAQVMLNYIVRDGSSFAHEPTQLTIPAHGRQWVSMRQLGFTDHDVSIVWESDNPVSVAAFSRRESAFIVTPSVRAAATQWTFARAFVDRVNASIMNTEDVLAFNPSDQPVQVQFTFTFRNGATSVVSTTVGAFEVADVDTNWPVQHIGAGHPFTVKVEASGPIVASLEHWNRRRISGHHSAQGIPSGTVVALSDVLVVPAGTI